MQISLKDLSSSPVYGTSTGGEGVHGDTDSVAAALAGYNHNGPALWGEYWGEGEAVHGISHG
jgi:hypothetical protein